MTVRVSCDAREQLDALAESTRRTRSYIAAEAIKQYLERNSWQVAQVQQAIAKADAGLRGVPHDEVDAWVRSWGTEHEHKRPTQ